MIGFPKMGALSIRTRLTVTFSAATGLLLLIVWAVLTASFRYSAEHTADVLLRDTIREICTEVTEASLSGLQGAIEEERATWGTEGLAVRVVDNAGLVVATSAPQGPSWPRPSSGRSDGWRTVTQQAGSWTVVVGVPWEATEQSLRTQAFALAGFCVLIMGMVTGGAWWLVGRTLAPIDGLARQAALQSTQESLHTRLIAPSDDAEVQNLVTTLNGLLDQISRVAEAKGAFYRAASHELRTPLHVLCGQAELALSRPRSADEYRTALSEIQDQAERLNALTRSLLLLHRLEMRTNTIAQEPTDLACLCHTALATLAPTIHARQLQLRAQLPEVLIIPASPLYLQMLVRNLLDNAVQYATPGGVVEIEVAELPVGMVLRIVNTTTLPPETDLGRLLEPFYRPDASRTASTGGNGLGLAICKAIVESSGWGLRLQWISGAVCATVTFPNIYESATVPQVPERIG